MFRKLALVILACFLLGGCDYKATLEKFVPKDDDALARRFLELVRTGDYAAANQMLEVSLQGEKSEEGFRELHGVLAHGEQLSFEVIGVDIHTFASFPSSSNSTKRVALTYQIRFPDKWAAGTVTVQHFGENTKILGARFNWLPDSLESLNRFTFSGKSVVHYLVLIACIAVPVFVIFTLIVCIRTPVSRRKWLWVIFIFFGVGNFQFAWTSGQFDVHLLYFWLTLPGATMSRSSPYASWVFSFMVPVGAIIFWAARRKLRTPGNPGEKDSAPPPLPPPLMTT